MQFSLELVHCIVLLIAVVVVAQFHETEVHGEVIVIVTH